jgi:hypothetical protein
MGGCAGEDEGVASISGQSDTVTVDGERQRATAEAMARCLTDASVDARTRELEDGPRQLEVLPADDGPLWQLCWVDGCTLGGGQGLPADDVRATVMRFEELGSGRDPVGSAAGDIHWLIVDAVDRTDAWNSCASATGYSRPTFHEDPTAELQRKTRIAAAGAQWAACARENGFSDTRDPDPPVADNWETTPSATLPGDITSEQLRALLATCPAFDTTARAAADLALTQDPGLTDDEYWRIAGENPSISFDIPCAEESGDGCGDADLSKEMGLYQVLEEDQNRYLQQLNASHIPASPDN